MDALLFADEWQEKAQSFEEGRFPLVDEIQGIAKVAAPDWPQYSITRTKWHGSNSRFVTPFEHPVAFFGPNKRPVFDKGKEIDGYPGVFELIYRPGVKPIMGKRLAPTPKDPDRLLAKLTGFEEYVPQPTNPTSKKPDAAASADGGGE